MLEGYAALESRLRAIHPASMGQPMMARLGAAAIREQRLGAPRKTGNLQRTIHIAELTPTSVTTVASASYAAGVEFGTKPHLIMPKAKKALAWAAAGGARLTGSARVGAQMIFARVVHHPGTKPQPFMVPGAQKAIATAGLKDIVYAAWNRAA